jgi:hypothetical protein
MKYAPLVAAVMLLGASVAMAAQPTDIPPVKCEAPKLPGSRMMEDTSIRKRFERDMKAHEECVKAYVAERNTAAKAHADAVKANNEAASAAVNDYNALLKSINEAAKQ